MTSAVILPKPIVSAQWLRRHLDDVVVVDVRWYLDERRGRDAYLQGHVPGAAFADLDTDLSAPPGDRGRHPLPTPDAFASAMSRLGIGDDSRVVAYDDAAGAIAARLWWMLDAVGHEVAVLDGGIQAWDGPLETEPRDPSPAVFTPRPWPPDRFADADDVARRAATVTLIDARAGERYDGRPNAIDPRFGHIPGAVSAPWAGNVGDGLLLPPERLAERYRELGVDADRDVIAYCGSGVTACHDLLALRVAGVGRPRLYVGSWSEWGADPSRPLEASDPGNPQAP